MKVLITGSTDGIGRATAEALLDDGHEVIVHGRNKSRVATIDSLLDRGAAAVVGDLSDMDQTRRLADQVNALGRVDTVIHNAGVMVPESVLPVNVVAPYLLTALIERPQRLIYLSSSMHRHGRQELDQLDWDGRRETASYSDSKLFVTAMALGIARRWPGVWVNSVDPGWVPTRMGGPEAADDLHLGHLTQVWLATAGNPDACSSGGFWFHQQRREPCTAASDVPFQDRLIEVLECHTGTVL